ncbi:MetQ/NlpA family ABC transporter substrate-binding protein [Uliginosibacterium sp. H3]|uniref:MetQ/NlpA family ABC transporter substrate-binding protein n=1 Tax=Uliginosibacterium silvisoli TaxID=3114758 RepID=A0ABU6K6K9_9RHOO|nr:MetQ/NlpA family ABC transporter substrate-binding protein [Uliginosibacterium sp. H3]
MQYRRHLLLATLLATAFSLPVVAQEKPIKIGVTAGPHAQILDAARKVAEREGLKIQIVEFTDYIQPNAALAAGDLDANSYQHKPYLDQQIKDRGYPFASVGYTITFPMGVYSRKTKSLDALKEGARIGIPNDPTNGGRALLLLEAKGVLKLKPNIGLKATPLDIADNPKKVRIVEIDAAQLPRSLDDLDAAAINGNYAESAGLDPIRDGIAVEGPTGPYANLIAVRAADKDKPWVKKLVTAYQSAEVKQFIRTTFKDSVIPAW